MNPRRAPSKPDLPHPATSASAAPNALPTVPVPSPPAGFVAAPPSETLGFHPRQAEVANAPAVVEELRAFTDYDKVFGATVPPADRVAAVLDHAVQWRAQRDAAVAWAAYVRAQDARAWQDAFALLDDLKPGYQLAARRNPQIAAAYPRLAAFFDAHKQIAQRATATKKAKARAAEAAAAGAEPSGETEP